MRKTLVMMAGLCGMTASTFASTVMVSASRKTPLLSTTTGAPFAGLDLIGAEEMCFGGWDLRSTPLGSLPWLASGTDLQVLEELANIKPLPAVRTALDIPVESDHTNNAADASLAAAVDRVSANIDQQKQLHDADSVVVIYLASPHASPAGIDIHDLVPKDQDRAEQAYPHLPSSFVYGMGAARAGAHFVDFTPGVGLESQLLHDVAEAHGGQLAGRDGSTGQTFLKSWLAEMLSSRGLQVRAWYSTNVIGNHDGYVLSMPDHASIKLADKKNGLQSSVSYDVSDHHITIDYVPYWGDRKESWDAVMLEGWVGSTVELRLNWRGSDSYLAAPLLFDIVRLLEYGERKGLSGFRPELGLFFKRPLGREGKAASELYRELVSFYNSL